MKWNWLLPLAAVAMSADATMVDLTLYNSNPVFNNDGVTPLRGTISGGNFVQVILVGNNGVIDAPTILGAPGGDDQLLTLVNNPTHIGAGVPNNPNEGLLEQAGMIFDAQWVGASAYVRFWNADTPASATHYGNSMLLVLPTGDVFGQAALDFIPSAASPHITDTPVDPVTAVPEPSNLFLLGLLLMGGYRLRKCCRRFAVAVILLGVATARAQDLRRFDVTASAPIRDADSVMLPNGSRVQILDAGPNGAAELPDLAGNPTGDDSLIATTVIGQGIAPNMPVSGRFSFSFYPPPANGRKIYARVFTATSWGQSGTFVVDNVKVFDVSTAGLSAATLPVGRDAVVTDSDGDGQTDYEELTAGTNAQNPNDRLKVSAFTPESVGLAGRIGRQYTLERTTNELTGPVVWSPIVMAGPLSVDQNLMLVDPSPPAAERAFYRVRVVLP